MEEWRLIDLGSAEPLIAQGFYEAVALAIDRGLASNTIILVQPSSPYVCIGYHQRLEEEIDLGYCRSRGLPIIRRYQGGGAVYLDSGQVFYQVIGHEGSLPSRVEELFEKLLQVTVYVYRELGVEAEYKPINDVVVGGRKISGNGAGRIGRAIILVGNIILDFDYDSMVRVLKVPDEKFRDKVAKSMREWLTTLRRELGYTPPVEEVKRLLREGYEKVLGISLKPSEPTEEEWRIFDEEVKPRHLSDEWLYMPEMRRGWIPEGRMVKIADGVRVVHINHKAAKMIRVTAELREDEILDLLITGDFFMIPEDSLPRLEEMLKGARLNQGELLKRVEAFYRETGVQTPGLKPQDFVDALMKLREAVERYLPSIRPSAESREGVG